MRSNGLLKWLMIPVALVVLFFGIRLFSNGGSKVPIGTDASAQLTPDEMKALGIQGDTPRDTVATRRPGKATAYGAADSHHGQQVPARRKPTPASAGIGD